MVGDFSNILALAIFGVDAQKGIVIRESKKKFNNVQKFISTNMRDYKLMSYCKNCI